VGEPTRLGICTAHKGDVAYEVTTSGKAAHASVLHEGINAIYKMKKIIDAIEKLDEELEARKKHPLLGTSTMSVGTIEGGTIPAAVPASCKIKVDRRLLPSEDAEMGKRELEGLIDNLRKQDPDLVARVRVVVDAPPMETRQDEAIVTVLRDAVVKVTGADPGITGVPYTTDGAILVKNGGIPTVIFGPGDIRQAHQPNECIPVDEMVTATKIYALTALELLS
jgi:acetylornithine deacetylase/succinyl-diaminopimelate desuccinylase-like protein